MENDNNVFIGKKRKSFSDSPIFFEENKVFRRDERKPATYRPKYTNEKIFKDPIHRSIMMEPICLEIIDTPEFQRLHHLHQLGTCSYVFRGAHHTRFEHSLGVAHLAEKLLTNIRQTQSYLNITDIDILCVKIAALCHDLGHGPFSHLFDGVFMRKIYPNGINNRKIKIWRHEEGSIGLLEQLLKSNRINYRAHGLTPIDFEFIKEMILGTAEPNRLGRGKDKSFLYDVVNNVHSGLDVDKLDYFQRDMHYTKAVSSNFDRFIQLGRVMRVRKDPESVTEHEDDFRLMICYPQKMVGEAVDLFQLRFKMHQEVYAHKSVKKLEYLVTDAMIAADPFVRIPGTKKEDFPDGLYKMSECIFDPAALANLDDRILCHIQISSDPNLKDAQNLLKKIVSRDLYPCLGKANYDKSHKIHGMSDREIVQEIVAIANQSIAEMENKGIHYAVSFRNSDEETEGEEEDGSALGDEENVVFSQDSQFTSIKFENQFPNSFTLPEDNVIPSPLQFDDLIAERMHIHYGMGDKNPVDSMRFYNMKDFNYISKIRCSESSPENTQSQEQDMIGFDDNKGAIYQQYEGIRIKEEMYHTRLPRVFEDRALRMFCRDQSKARVARDAFEKWCKDCKASAPFPLLQSPTPQKIPLTLANHKPLFAGKAYGKGELSQPSELFDI